MAGKGRIKIVYRDPSVASFAASDIVMNVTTGTLFYKRTTIRTESSLEFEN